MPTGRVGGAGLTRNDPTARGLRPEDLRWRCDPVALGFETTENVRPLDARDVRNVQKLYKMEDLDFRLKAGSAAVDKGKLIPQVTDGYAGEAPDLGAVELGQPLPHYGPRSIEEKVRR